MHKHIYSVLDDNDEPTEETSVKPPAIDDSDSNLPMSLDRTNYHVSLHLDSYIAQPYWQERNDVINIEKLSGYKGAGRSSQATRQEKLEAYLDSIGTTVEAFEAMRRRAARQWRRIDDNDESSRIMIGSPQFDAFLAHVCTPSSTKSIRGILSADNSRALVRSTNFLTNKTKCDEVWGRFAVLKESNQRSWQTSEVIKDFTAEGKLSVPSDLDIDQLQTVIRWGLDRIGIGASRKMGYGRGKLTSFTLAEK